MRVLIDGILAIILSAIFSADTMTEEWNAFKAAHGKTYSGPVEEELRMKVYMENKVKIADHNRLAQEGHHSYFLKMNHFGDLLPSEIAALHGQHMNTQTEYSGATFTSPEDFEVPTPPTEVDWRSEGAVTEVRDQATR